MADDGRPARQARSPVPLGPPCRRPETDLRRLAELDLALIADLRRAAERARYVSRRPSPARAVVLEHGAPIDAAMAPHLAFLNHPDASPEYVTELMIRGYRSYPFDPYYVALYRQFFEQLADADGPALIHCHAGKDRTGLLAALTLHLLGVSREHIYEDYLRTNQNNRVDARLAPLMADFERDHGRPVDAALLRQVLAADARFLDAAFEEIAVRHGDTDAYIEAVLEVGPERRARIREALLERA